MTLSNIILIATVTCLALMAGLFYSYSCSVVLALKLLPASSYIQVMQSVNKAIQNPVFFLAFFGTLVLLPLNAYMRFSRPASPAFWLFLAAALVYFLGVFCVTAFGNIPLNNALEKFNILGASAETIGLRRESFEGKWNTLNTVRTIFSILSLVLAITGCVISSRAEVLTEN